MAHPHFKTWSTFALMSSVLFTASMGSSAAAGLYKWTDANGETHYSDSAPPANTDYGHDILSKQGVTVEQVSRALTQEERTAALTESKKLTPEQEFEIRQQRIDRLISSAFPNFETLHAARDGRLEILGDSVAYLESRKVDVKEKMAITTKRIKHFKSRDLSIPEELLAEYGAHQSKVDHLDVQIAEILHDRQNITREFQEYEDRLTELLAE